MNLNLLRLLAAVLVAAMLALVPSCRGPAGGIDPNALQGTLPKVLDRHDVYVEADPALDLFEKEVYLASTAKLRDVLAAALSANREATSPILPPIAPPPAAASDSKGSRTGVR